MTSTIEHPNSPNAFRLYDPGPPDMMINDDGAQAHATELNGHARGWSKSRLPDISRLQINDENPSSQRASTVTVPEDIIRAATSDPAMQRLRVYAQSLPYSIEPNSKAQEFLDLILMRMVQCVKAKDFDPGFSQWDCMLSYWLILKYPVPKEKRAALVKLYYEVATLPGMPQGIINIAVDGLQDLTRSKKKLTVKDLRMPWKPIYELLSNELFLPRRKFELNQLPDYMGRLANSMRRFFHPACINEMLETFLPLINGNSVNSILSSEFYLLSFLPQTHPQSYLPMLFRLWRTINSYTFDGRMLEFLGELSEIHVDPTASDPQVVSDLPDDAKSEGEGRPVWVEEDLRHNSSWRGIFKDVGIYTDEDWQFIMCKCLAVMEIPLNDAGSLTTGPSVDRQASFEVKKRLPSFNWRISSLAKLIVYSMAPDSLPVPPSGVSTPFTPGSMTPVPETNIGDYLSSPLGKKSKPKVQTYLAGSKALDSLAHMIASTESFFHPTNSGAWTSDLTAFIKYVVYEFNKRWYEEQKPECKTPYSKRLTRDMKRELVKCLRTVTLLAMFSSDSTTVANVQGCLKSMTIMEPDLILHPILERAIPALEALVETHRTMAVIQALGSIALALVSRDVYYPGAKHLVPLLQLLIPGIDVNDPNKTLVTTQFLVEISQYIKYGDLTSVEARSASDDTQMVFPDSPSVSTKLPELFIDMPDNSEQEARLSAEDEDNLLKESTASFANWISSFIGRVILLLESLPEEGADGNSRTGASEIQVVDAVTAACSQICVHLSDPLFDLVLNMVYDYASSTVRSNAVRAVHQLVECLANANCEKTLARFVPLCLRNIKVELDHGASSIRTTSMADPIPSDTTLHWNLAILRGVMSNDGSKILKYKDELLNLFNVLRSKTFSKPGYLRSGKLLTNVLLSLTHTYPMDNRFVNPDEWRSEQFKTSHHLSWGKLYSPEDVKIAWHVPSAGEVKFAIDIFREIVEPTLSDLEELLKTGSESRDSTWRNNFCRYLTFVRDAFGGTPTLFKDQVDMNALKASVEHADYYYEIPEMIGHIPPFQSCFVIIDASDPRHIYLSSLRSRFGSFLNTASVSLRQQGDVNTIDAVHLLLDAMRTFSLIYGDTLDSYSAQSSIYAKEISYARQHAEQCVWPRAVLVRRARRYHAARLRWNSIERLQGERENAIIDELVQWSMWNYITVREIAQSILVSMTGTYDGVRRRAVPKLIESIKPGNDVNTIKGALWTLNMSEFGSHATLSRYRISYLRSLFSCQPHHQPSVQDRVAVLLENLLGCISEPLTIIYSTESVSLDKSADQLERLLLPVLIDNDIVKRCTEQRVIRIESMDRCSKETIDETLAVAGTSTTHWRYSLVALRLLRAHIRRDEPLSPSLMKYFLGGIRNSHPSMRYYASRAVMKSLRYIKLRTFFHSPRDTALCKSRNPLRVQVGVRAENQSTEEFLDQFKVKIDLEGSDRPLLLDRISCGWLVWAKSVDQFLLPDAVKSAYKPWEAASGDTIKTLRDTVNNADFWKDLGRHYSEENHGKVITQDNVSCVKSIFQILEDEPFEYLKPTLEGLLEDVDHNKQRAAAEMLAGVIGGMKHWPTKAQSHVWEWLSPFLDKMLGSNVKSDTLSIWMSFLSYLFYRRDPRRIQPLVDHITEKFKSYDFESQSPFSATIVVAFMQSMYEDLGWRSAPWFDEIMDCYWRELDCKHDEVRNYIADALEFSGKVMWRPKPSIASPEVFVRECRTVSPDFDIMDARGTYHGKRVAEIVRNFKIWREERLPGARVLQSKYDRAGTIVCKWLFSSMHDVQASSNFDYILPLMPELLRFSELNDNDELSRRASNLIVRMCGVIPPKELIDPLIDSFFVAVKSSPSWRLRLRTLPFLQIFYFRLSALITESKVLEIVEVICWCLDDENIEVREMAATTLSGVLRLSPRHSIITLKNRFVRLIDNTTLPDKTSPGYASALRKLHAAILGVCAIIDSYPYSVERWMPSLLADVLSEHTYDPVPISTTVRKCAQNFKKTHQDTWHEDSMKFNEEQLSSLSTLLTGSSYYA